MRVARSIPACSVAAQISSSGCKSIPTILPVLLGNSLWCLHCVREANCHADVKHGDAGQSASGVHVRNRGNLFCDAGGREAGRAIEHEVLRRNEVQGCAGHLRG